MRPRGPLMLDQQGPVGNRIDVPEPATLLLFAIALALLPGWRRRARQAA